MKKTLATILLSLLVGSAYFQTYVYPNERCYLNDVICNIHNGQLNLGNSNMWRETKLTVKDQKIFKGFSTSTFDQLYSLQNGHLYLGDSSFSFDIVYTIKSGKVYRGESDMMMDCLFTYDPKTNKLYKGDSLFSLDAVLFFQGEALNDAELFATLLWLELL